MKPSRSMDPRLTVHKQLRPQERNVLQLVVFNPGSSRDSLAALASLSPNTLGSYLYDLSKADLVHCRGFGRGATWWPGAAPPAVVQIARNPLLNSVWSMA